MLARIVAIALNAYREAVRARVLHGLLAAALATCAYSLVVATLSMHQEARVIADVGAASISLYAVLVAVVLGATSLHREVEQKTIIPILTRALPRHEYLIGKYLGTLATLFAFIAIDAAAVLALLAVDAGRPGRATGLFAALVAVLVALALRFPRPRVFVTLPWSAALFAAMAFVSAGAGGERRLVVASALLTFAEVSIVAAVATLFASFASPFMTAVLTFGVFLIGRSADTLANLPPRVFGSTVHELGHVVARVVPNLQVYVPARPLLLGEVPDAPVWPFVAAASAHAVLYAAVLLTVSALAFRKRDFT